MIESVGGPLECLVGRFVWLSNGEMFDGNTVRVQRLVALCSDHSLATFLVSLLEFGEIAAKIAASHQRKRRHTHVSLSTFFTGVAMTIA